MPVISRFYGILIKMYFREHGEAHFHTLEMIEGDLPRRAQRLVREWAGQYQADLRTIWETQEYKKLPGLE